MSQRATTTQRIPVAHVYDPASISALIEDLKSLHGAGYEFGVSAWQENTELVPNPNRTRFIFVVGATDATIQLLPGQWVRGVPPGGPFESTDNVQARVMAPCTEQLWPGDVICIEAGAGHVVALTGQGTFFEVQTEPTAYQAPNVAFLRYLSDKPGGCAAYPGAFRREALPPASANGDAVDHRGTNRVNEHTLDMRIDRRPTPIRHYHGPVATGPTTAVNHSEIAIIIPRSCYNLPEVDRPDHGHIVVYRQPDQDLSDTELLPVRPGSIVVTPAATDNVMGHCFENAFAMLIAIPGFVAPYNMISDG